MSEVCVFYSEFYYIMKFEEDMFIASVYSIASISEETKRLSEIVVTYLNARVTNHHILTTTIADVLIYT